MKTPAFWGSQNRLSDMLWPLAALYGLGGTLRRKLTTALTLPVPVICIGNLTAGGAGKTPVALHIGQALKHRNISVFYISRGYGGALRGPVLVDAARHTAEEVGDEPLLLARVLPTVVAKNRVEGATFAMGLGAKMLVMDDGFQNPSIAKTLSFLVVDGRTGFGNGRLMPAGPLRETVADGMRRADAVILIGGEAELPTDKPVFRAAMQPVAGTVPLRGRRMLAFCGIAYPQKFFTMLASLGADLAGSVAFADHYPYRPADLEKLVSQAAQQQAMLVTTAKDAVRLPEAFRGQVTVIEAALAFEAEDKLDALLETMLGEDYAPR